MKFPLPKPPVNQQMNQKNIAQLNQKINKLSEEFKKTYANGDFLAAYQAVYQVLKLVPNHVVAIMDLALTELRLKRYDDAYRHYQQAIKLNPNKIDTNIYDGLAEVCHYLEKKEDVQKYGALALSSKKELVAHQPILKLITELPPHFNMSEPEQNIIAFSLFGANPRYCETSVINIDLAKEIYPAWTCRFYVDETVPQNIVERLTNKGAQVIYVNEEQKQFSGLFWRFLVMDDPTVKRFMIRDADSLVSYREKAAVNEWLNSDKWFHTMHDFYSHTELILAGMWGGCHGVFENIEQLIRDFIATGRFLNERVMDQHFLRYVVWSTIAQSIMIHDSQGFDADGMNFPTVIKQKEYELNPQFHVGMNEGASVITVEVKIPDSCVNLSVLDEQDQRICSYFLDVPSSRTIALDMPQHYALKIKDHAWKVSVNSIENKID